MKARPVALCINQFKRKIREGPYLIGTICNRILYKKSAIICINKKYPRQTYFNIQQLFDGKKYVCNTCHSKVIKGKLSCQAVVNNMYVDEIPTELSSLVKLEQILIAQRTLFKKIMVIPKGQHRKIKGATCSVPVECDQTYNQLPRPPNRSGIIMLKLKRKLQFQGHVYFQAVRPELIHQVLNQRKVHNPLYKDILIDINNIYSTLTALQNDAEDNDTHQQAASNNVTTDSDAALEYMNDAGENDKLKSSEEEMMNMRDMLRVNYAKLSRGECSSKTLDTKPE